MLNRDCCEELVQSLPVADFYSTANATIWEAIVQLVKQYSPEIDTVMLRGQLGAKLQSVGGDDYLIELTETIPTLSNAQRHAKRVSELAAVRRVITRCHEVAASGYGDIDNLGEWLDGAEKTLGEEVTRPDQTRSIPYRDVILSAYDSIQKQFEAKESMIGVPTGFDRLDRYTRGLCPGQLVICAGRPGMGKSAFAAGVASQAGPTLVFSLEMMRDQWGRRDLSRMARVDGHVLRGAVDIQPNEWPSLARAAGEASELPIHFWDGAGATVQDIVRESRRVARELRNNDERLGLIVVDYLQLIRATQRGRSREEEVAEASRELKHLGKEIGCAVLALAQLNRAVEQRPNKRPMMSDLRESGAVEQDADIILFIYRDEVYNPDPPGESNKGLAEIIIAKNREGRIGTCPVAWVDRYTSFEPLESEWRDGPPAQQPFDRFS